MLSNTEHQGLLIKLDCASWAELLGGLSQSLSFLLVWVLALKMKPGASLTHAEQVPPPLSYTAIPEMHF